MRPVRSNSGNSFSYAPLNPPDIKTLSCADAATGQNSAVVRMTNDKALMISSSPVLSDASTKLLAHTPAGDRWIMFTLLTSAPGQKQTFAPQKVTSALHPKADMCVHYPMSALGQ